MRHFSKTNLFLLSILQVSTLLSCGNTAARRGSGDNTDSLPSGSYQELGFFGGIKKDRWIDFRNAVQNNIVHSRKEPGNLAFSLYQPENDMLEPIWFERFATKSAHNIHKTRDYFHNAINVIQQSLESEPNSIDLKEVSEIPPAIASSAANPNSSRYVIVLFHLKSGKREAFIEAMSEAVGMSRQSTGNIEFNLYQYSADPDKFVLIEGWQNVADHKNQQRLPHIQKLVQTTAGFFESDPMKSRWVMKDISLPGK